MLTLSARLQLELRNRDPSEITELILDNSKANEIEGLDNSYSNLKELSLVNVGLTTLKGFPCLPNLERLDLSDNKIGSGLENIVPCTNIKQLLLTNNRIKNIKDLEYLSNLKNLEVLDLFNCAVSFSENYRKDVFSSIPSLKYLDGFDEKNEEELNESDEEYEEEDEEREVEDPNGEVYELSDNSESGEDYESEGEIIPSNDQNGGQSKTGGKDMNMFNNDVVELSDDEDDDDEDFDEDYEDDEDEDVEYDEDSNQQLEDPIQEEMNISNPSKNKSSAVESHLEVYDDEEEENEDEFNEVIVTNGKIRNVNDVDNYLSDSDEHLSDDDDEEQDDFENNTINSSQFNGNTNSVIESRKRDFQAAFDKSNINTDLPINNTHNFLNDNPNNDEEDDDDAILFNSSSSSEKKIKTSNDINDLLDDTSSV